MGYYMGDYYRGMRKGDYYRGDPGILSFLGNVGSAFASAIPVIGAPLSAGLKALGGIGKTSVKAIAPASSAGAGIAQTGTKLLTGMKGAVLKHPVLSGAAAAGVAGAGLGVGGTMLAHKLMGHRKHRRMHVTNVKALRRAIRRAKGFEKIARRVMHFTAPRAPKGRAIFRARKRKRVC